MRGSHAEEKFEMAGARSRIAISNSFKAFSRKRSGLTEGDSLLAETYGRKQRRSRLLHDRRGLAYAANQGLFSRFHKYALPVPRL